MTNYQPPSPFSPKEMHALVLQRLYHEDGLLSQRVYNFVTLNVVLATIETIAVSLNRLSLVTIDLGLLTGLSGLVFALLQTSRGIRTVRAFRFWRLYVESIEERLDLPFDRSLFDYLRKGTANIFGGWTIAAPPEELRRPLRPWVSWLDWQLGSVVFTSAVVTPAFVATFWLAALWVLAMHVLHIAPEWGWAVAGVALMTTGVTLLGVPLGPVKRLIDQDEANG